MAQRYFSLKILFHALQLDPNIFEDEIDKFGKPILGVKFLNYPTFSIPSKRRKTRTKPSLIEDSI